MANINPDRPLSFVVSYLHLHCFLRLFVGILSVNTIYSLKSKCHKVLLYFCSYRHLYTLDNVGVTQPDQTVEVSFHKNYYQKVGLIMVKLLTLFLILLHYGRITVEVY